MRRVALVTGACGFMGSHMVELLHENGWRVIATDIVGPIRYDNWDVFFRADLGDKEETITLVAKIISWLKGKDLFSATQDGDSFVVFDVKGLFDYSRSFPELYLANVTASKNLYETLVERWFKMRLIVWSAAGIYGDFPEVPAKETSPELPTGNYLTTKWVQEKVALKYSKYPDVCVSALRPAGVYGHRSRYGVATSIRLMSFGMMGPFRMGAGGNRVSTVHVRDVCGAAMYLTQAPHHDCVGEIFNVADDSSYTVAELSKFIGREVRFSFAPGIHLPFKLMEKMTADLMKRAKKEGLISMVDNEMSAILNLDALLDTSKLKATGWVPKYPDAFIGLHETIQEYREEDWL